MIKQAIERNRLSFKSLTITEVADWIKEVSTQETSVSLSGYPCIGIQKRTWRLLPKTNNVFLVNLLKKTFPDSLKRVISRLCLKKILWFLKNSLTNMSHMTCRSFFFFHRNRKQMKIFGNICDPPFFRSADCVMWKGNTHCPSKVL